MGWQDRDYSDESYGKLGSVVHGVRRPPGGTLALMILHGAAFLLMLMLQSGEGVAVVKLLALKGAGSHPLGIVLHPIATGNPFSIAFVVLAFWSLGGRLEPGLGTQQLVGMYLVANLAAGGVYFGVARWVPALAHAPLDYPVGALAGLCMLAWRHLRGEPVRVFRRVTSAARVYAICGAIVVGLAVLGSGAGALAWIAAVVAGGGSALLVERWSALRIPRRRRARQVVRPSIPRSVVPPPPPDEADIDEILAKISRAGLDALTDAERKRLEAARRAKLRRPR